MKKILKFVLLLLPAMLSAQQADLSNEDYRKIMRHLQMQYRVPPEVIKDTVNRIDYNYKVQFTINEDGRIIEPKIISKTAECSACEQELIKVLKRTPAVTPPQRDGEKIKALFQMPFVIQLE